MNGFNLSDIQDANLGGTQLSAIYLGSSKLWPTHDYSQEYFTIESLEDNNEIYIDNTWGGSTSNTPSSRISFTFEYSADKTNWTTVTITRTSGNASAISETFTTLNTGDKLYIRGNQYTAGQYYANNSTQYLCYNILKCTGYSNIYGNIMSLRYKDNFLNQTTLTGTHCFYRLFFNNEKIINASNLILPATTLTNYCYYQMFYGCTELKDMPKSLPATTLAYACYYEFLKKCTNITTVPSNLLPATTLATECYRSFFDSTGITTAPNLPATKLAQGCYRSMFYNCKSLTTAPVLPATTLVQDCYRSLFYGCSSLNYIKAMFTTTPGGNYTRQWTQGVAASGTYVKNSAAPYTNRGQDGIPSGWTVENV